MRFLLLVTILAAPLAACSAESPFSVYGKPKLAGPPCPGSPGGCPGDPQP